MIFREIEKERFINIWTSIMKQIKLNNEQMDLFIEDCELRGYQFTNIMTRCIYIMEHEGE